MSCPIDKESLEKLKGFVDVCIAKPEILHLSELSFLKQYIESLGGTVPKIPKMSTPEEKPASEPAAEKVEENAESDPESVLEFDMEGCIEPDVPDDTQKMGDFDKQPTEEEVEQADAKRMDAMSQFSEGNFEKAIELYSEAIELNPQSASLFSKRGQVFLKLSKPNACIKDCSRALELNYDSAAAYKFRGRAYRLLGLWELSAKDLRQAVKIDFDEQTDEWLKEVQPNAHKIQQHNLKQERKKLEKEEQLRQERVRQAREAHAKAAKGEAGQEMPNMGGGGQAPPPMGDIYKLLQDPEIMAAFQDPEVAAAFQDISTNPTNFMKYQSNPKIKTVLDKLSSKVGSGMFGFPGAGAGGFPGYPGGFPGANAPTSDAPPSATDDDALD